MAALNGVTEVLAPAVDPRPASLYQAAEVVGAEGRETQGVTFETERGFAPNLVDDDSITCIATAEKEFEGLDWEGGRPFSIYAGVRCNLFLSDDYEARANARLAAGEERAVEGYLWENVFPYRAVDLTPESGALSPRRALGLLEKYAGQNYLGRATVHGGAEVSVLLMGHGTLVDDATATKTGSKYVDGAGYLSLDGPVITTPPIADVPVITLGAASGEGSDFEAGTYFWVLTATDGHGETLVSNEVTATLEAGNQQIINWTAVDGATGYKLYRGTAAGEEDVLVSTLGAVITATDTGAAGTEATLPTENTTGYDTPTVAGDGEVWLYVTGQITLRRGDVFSQMVSEPSTNTKIALAERTIVPTIDVLVGAVRVALGD